MFRLRCRCASVIRVYYSLLVSFFYPRYFLHSRVIGAYPATTDCIAWLYGSDELMWEQQQSYVLPRVCAYLLHCARYIPGMSKTIETHLFSPLDVINLVTTCCCCCCSHVNSLTKESTQRCWSPSSRKIRKEKNKKIGCLKIHETKKAHTS